MNLKEKNPGGFRELTELFNKVIVNGDDLDVEAFGQLLLLLLVDYMSDDDDTVAIGMLECAKMHMFHMRACHDSRNVNIKDCKGYNKLLKKISNLEKENKED